jgi:hypothetical protein
MFTFDLSGNVTLGQLAEHVERLSRLHGGLFLPVQVRLASAAGLR